MHREICDESYRGIPYLDLCIDVLKCANDIAFYLELLCI